MKTLDEKSICADRYSQMKKDWLNRKSDAAEKEIKISTERQMVRTIYSMLGGLIILAIFYTLIIMVILI